MRTPKMKLNPSLLTHPNIPKPLHGLNPRTIMGLEWWNRQRTQALSDSKNTCCACGVSKKDAYRGVLEIHENYHFDYENGRLTILDYVSLCVLCHSYIHSGLLNVKLSRGEITEEFFNRVHAHGDKILADADIAKPELPIDVVEWSDWRLIFDGNEYAPLWKSREDWFAHYNK